MKRVRTYLLFCAMATALSGCKDLLEEDLNGYGVVLLTPPEEYTTTANQITFRWEAVPGASHYRIQIANPDLSAPVLFVMDSLVTTASITTTLSPGTYQWRVRGENPNSATNYYQRSLIVNEATTLEGLTPQLLAPTMDAATSADPVAFSWEVLAGAVDHRFELRDGSSDGAVVLAQIVSGSTLTLEGINEGSYAWGVQAQNSTSVSTFSYRTLLVDRTAPGAPVLISPADEAELPQAPFTLQWQSGQNAGANSTDSVHIVDAAQQLIRALPSVTQSHGDSLGSGVYTWYIRTTDRAGNGTNSATRTFTVQ